MNWDELIRIELELRNEIALKQVVGSKINNKSINIK